MGEEVGPIVLNQSDYEVAHSQSLRDQAEERFTEEIVALSLSKCISQLQK